MPTPRRPSHGSGTAAAVGAALVMVVCCVGPALLAGGALGALGGVLRSPWLIAVGTLVVATAIILVVRRGRADRAHCCRPPLNPPGQEQQADPDPSGRSD